jgi:hypothetical protein
MKKLIYILVAAVIFSGCEDELDRLPKDQLIEASAYQTVTDLERGLFGAIGNLSFNPIIGFNAIFTDNTKLGVDNGGQELNTLNAILNAQTGDRGLWGNRYGFINDLNRLIEAAELITPSSEDAETYNNILGQSYAFRAYAHSTVLLYYGLDFMDPDAGGIPYTTQVSTSATPGRLTTQETLDAINADLDLAESLLPATSTDKNFASVDMINFLRARNALYSGDYNTAITLADDLIASYPLANNGEYFGMFNNDTNDTEVIFKYDNVQDFNYNHAGQFIFTGTGGSFVEASNELFDLLDNNDIRKQVIFDPSTDDSANLHVIGKYPANADALYINDFKAMRISEMYLIRAEAHARKAAPDFALSATDVNAVRTIRTIGTSNISYANLIDAITAIKLERRLELAFEGHRYIDTKRYRNILNEGMVRDAADCATIACSVPVNSNKWIFPIPQSEINSNPSLAGSQAPGY